MSTSDESSQETSSSTTACVISNQLLVALLKREGKRVRNLELTKRLQLPPTPVLVLLLVLLDDNIGGWGVWCGMVRVLLVEFLGNRGAIQ